MTSVASASDAASAPLSRKSSSTGSTGGAAAFRTPSVCQIIASTAGCSAAGMPLVDTTRAIDALYQA